MEAYFYCHSHPDPSFAYHDYICLAEGLKALGIQCFGDRSMYKSGEKNEFLIQHKKAIV